MNINEQKIKITASKDHLSKNPHDTQQSGPAQDSTQNNSFMVKNDCVWEENPGE